MGRKVHPFGFRIGTVRDWRAKWHADRHFADYLQEDLKLRKAIEDSYKDAGISQVEIERQAHKVTVTIFTSRPGIVIGRGGQRVDEMRRALEKHVGKKVALNIQEIGQPETDAFLVARNVADQISRRIAYRRAMKQSMSRTMQAGAQGIKIRCAGRLAGAEIARVQTMHQGRVPLHTLRADIDYGVTKAKTAMGDIGVKVWIYRGDILPELEEAFEEPVVEAIVEPPSEEKLSRAKARKPKSEEASEEEKPGMAGAEPAEIEAGAEKVEPVESAPAKKKSTRKGKTEAAKKEEQPVSESSAIEETKKPVKKAAKPKVVEVTEEESEIEEKPAKPKARQSKKVEEEEPDKKPKTRRVNRNKAGEDASA